SALVILLVLPFLDPKRSMASLISTLSYTLPKATCLGTIFIGSSICHGQGARTRVLQDEILIIKFLPIGRLATRALRVCEVTTLAHKSQNNPVKAGSFITRSFLPSARCTKVLCRLWNFGNS
ncbi:Hypothetical predicted protein, partial [Lynx pardinus]